MFNIISFKQNHSTCNFTSYLIRYLFATCTSHKYPSVIYLNNHLKEFDRLGITNLIYSGNSITINYLFLCIYGYS